MKIQHVLTVTALCVLTACTTVPSKPVLGTNQILTNDKQIQSKQGSYVVRVSKVDTKTQEYRDIAKYGLPVRVTVANLSKKPIKFGAENVQILKNGKPVPAFTTAGLAEIKRKKDRNEGILAGVMGALSVSVGVLGALTGDASLALSTQQQTEDSLNYTLQNYEKSTQYNADRMNALSHQVSSTVLNTTTLKPNQVLDGLVFFENIKTSEAMTIQIQTEDVKHIIVYQK